MCTAPSYYSKATTENEDIKFRKVSFKYFTIAHFLPQMVLRCLPGCFTPPSESDAVKTDGGATSPQLQCYSA